MTYVTLSDLRPEWSRLTVLAKRLSVAGLIVIGLIGGSIITGEWPHELSGKRDAPHNDTSEVQGGPPQTITVPSATATHATAPLIRLSR